MMPPNFEDQLLNLQRRRGLAESLRERGLQNVRGETQFAGGRAIANPAVGNINAILQQLLGSFQTKKLTKEETEVKDLQKQDRFDFVKALQANRQPDELQTIGIDPSRLNIDRLTPANISGINELNVGVVEDREQEKSRKKNERFELLLSGLDKGGFAQAIAGTELAGILGPRARKTVPGVPGITTDGRGNFFDTSDNPLTSEQIQEIATKQRRAGATNITQGSAINDLAKSIQAADRTLTFGQALQQAQIVNQGGQLGELAEQQQDFGTQASGFGQIPVQQPQLDAEDREVAKIEANEFTETGNRLIDTYLRDGQLTGFGISVLGIKPDGTLGEKSLLNPEKQKKLADSQTNTIGLLEDINLIREVVVNDNIFFGIVGGSDKLFALQGFLDEIGVDRFSEALEVKAALRRMQTAGKIDMIGQAGGVRAFDSEREMASLFESLTNEKMDRNTIITSLDRIEERANVSLDNADVLNEFITATGNAPFSDVIQRPQPFVPAPKASPGKKVIQRADGTFEEVDI